MQLCGPPAPDRATPLLEEVCSGRANTVQRSWKLWSACLCSGATIRLCARGLLTEQHASDWMDASGTHNSTFNKDAELYSSNGQGTLRRCLGPVMQDLNGPSLANEVMLSTKDVNKTNSNHLKCQAKVAQGDLSGPGRGSYAFSSKQSERAIRDQIQRVVVNLEEVLHGLKEIHLEMKEVKVYLSLGDVNRCSS